ncbi:MAG: VWA domain-containing protein [Kiritimatiellia bacterium]
MNPLRHLFLSVFAAALAVSCSRGPAIKPPASDFEVRATLSTNRVAVGEAADLTLEVFHSADSTVQIPELDRPPWIVLREKDIHTTEYKPGVSRTLATHRFVSLRPGKHLVVTGNVSRVSISGSSFTNLPLPRLEIDVRSVLKDVSATLTKNGEQLAPSSSTNSVAPARIMPIRDALHVPKEPVRNRLLILVCFVAALALLLGLVGWFATRYANRPRTARPPPPPIPPHVVALRELEALKASGVIERGESEPFFVAISSILRRYVEDRFHVRAPEMTTEEFIEAAAGSRELAPAHQLLMREFLDQLRPRQVRPAHPRAGNPARFPRYRRAFRPRERPAGKPGGLVVRFAHPWLLLLLLVVPLLVWLRHRSRRAATVTFSDTRLLDGLPRTWAVRIQPLLPVLFGLGLAAVVVAMARPQKGLEESRSEGEVVDIMLIIDVSPSMKALDFSTRSERLNRLDAARRVAREFIDGRPDDRIGLVVFAGLTYSLSPLTQDHEWLQQQVDRMQIGMAGDGTAIGSAIAAATNRLRDSEAKSKVMVLLTDGVSNMGSITPDNAAEAAKALGLKVYTVAAGREGLVPVPMQTFFGQEQIVNQPSDFDRESLEKIARTTGARFFWAPDLKTLREVYSDIDKMERTEIKTQIFTRYRDLYQPVLGVGIGLLLLEKLLSLGRAGRLLS